MNATQKLKVVEHEIWQDKQNLIVRHPFKRKECKGRFSHGNKETYFTKAQNLVWELKSCCKVKLSTKDQQNLLSLKGACD